MLQQGGSACRVCLPFGVSLWRCSGWSEAGPWVCWFWRLLPGGKELWDRPRPAAAGAQPRYLRNIYNVSLPECLTAIRAQARLKVTLENCNNRVWPLGAAKLKLPDRVSQPPVVPLPCPSGQHVQVRVLSKPERRLKVFVSQTEEKRINKKPLHNCSVLSFIRFLSKIIYFGQNVCTLQND